VNLLQRLRKLADKIALKQKRLKWMPADRAISLMRLRPNGGQAAAKSGQETELFDLISIRLKHLYVVPANLSGLRRRCDEPEANWWHPCFATYTAWGRIWIFARRREGK
jgi:hypothetical protein